MTAEIATMPTLAEAVSSKLQQATCPMRLSEVVKGIPRPRKTPGAQFLDDVRSHLDECCRLGRAFCHPSGKNGEPRYWSRDEKRLLCEKAGELAGQPQMLSSLRKGLTRSIKGVDPAYAESLLRELIDDGRLFEHLAKSSSGNSRYGVAPPPPPLEKSIYQKPLRTLVAGCRNLLSKSGVELETLLETLRLHLTSEPVARESLEATSESAAAVDESINDLILKAVANESDMSLAELRREMPREFQGEMFDAAVLQLAAEARVKLTSDANAAALAADQLTEYVHEGSQVYTNISSGVANGELSPG